MDINVLDFEIIQEIHAEQIALHSGNPGYFPDTIDRVCSILCKQIEVVFGYEPYPSIINKASMLLYFFAKDHCFQDGNKRVALVSCILLLELNGYTFTASNEEAEAITYSVAETNFTGDQHFDYIMGFLSDWITKNTIDLYS